MRCICGVSSEAGNTAYFVTATMKMLLIRTWKNDVDPSVMMGDRTSGFDTTWILKTSEMERLVG